MAPVDPHDLDIGEPTEAPFIVEPLEDPFRRATPKPDPPAPAPVKPDREPLPA